MATEDKGNEQQQNQPPAGGQPPAAASPPPAAAGAGGQPPPAAKPGEEKKPEPKPEPKRASLKSDADEIPEDAEIVEMPLKALKRRLSKHTNAELKAQFGTSDAAEIKKKLARADELEKAEEDRKKAAMTEAEKKDAELAEYKARAEKAERRERAIYQARSFEREDNRMLRLSQEFFDEDYAEDQLPKLAKHLAETFDDKALDAMKPAEVDKIVRDFFKELAERKPKLAREAKAPEKKKVPANNTANDKDRPGERREGGQNPAEGKTFKPGQQNSMTKREAQDALRKQFGGRLPY